MSVVQIRDLTPGDLDAVLDNRKRAFGPLSASSVATWRSLVAPALPEGRYLGAFDGGRLVATSRINHYEQWWHGRPLSMGGIAGVTVAPEDRGRGVGGLLMRATIERCAELGHAVSALYPTTTPLYRGAGWEHAGARLRVTVPAESLRALAPRDTAVAVRRAGPGDAAEIRALLGRLHAATRACGPVVEEERVLRLWLEDDDDFAYLAADGFLLYRWDGDGLDVDNLVAGSEATARALWSLAGSASSVAATVTATVEPDDPMLWLARDRSTDTVERTGWMLRIIDLPAAVAGRGYPAGAALDAVVEVSDPRRPANSGAWRLSVASGRGEAVRVGPLSGGPGRPGAEVTRLTVGGLSALFAGVGVSALRRAGLVTGGTPATDDLLACAFAAKPYMIDYF
ncbi:UPF0256 protein [Sphaerisporangium siamense]|nr:UPF0256 protein [Sphaerisporangium siamense]